MGLGASQRVCNGCFHGRAAGLLRLGLAPLGLGLLQLLDEGLGGLVPVHQPADDGPDDVGVLQQQDGVEKPVLVFLALPQPPDLGAQVVLGLMGVSVSRRVWLARARSVALRAPSAKAIARVVQSSHP